MREKKRKLKLLIPFLCCVFLCKYLLNVQHITLEYIWNNKREMILHTNTITLFIVLWITAEGIKATILLPPHFFHCSRKREFFVNFFMLFTLLVFTIVLRVFNKAFPHFTDKLFPNILSFLFFLAIMIASRRKKLIFISTVFE